MLFLNAYIIMQRLGKWKVHKIDNDFCLVKSSKNFYLNFIWLYSSRHPERIFWKYPFWKYNSWFSSEVSKPTSANSLMPFNSYYFHLMSVLYLISRQSDYWHIRRKLAVISSKRLFSKKIFEDLISHIPIPADLEFFKVSTYNKPRFVL